MSEHTTTEEVLESKFSAINNVADLSEQFMLDVVAKSATWLSPMVPAILIHASVTEHLNAIPWWGALLLAYVIEALGITTVTNTMVQWEICQKNGNDDNWKLFWVALTTATFYIVINLLLVIFLKVYPDSLASWAMGLMTLLSVVAGVGTVMRVRQAKEAIEERKQKRIAEQEEDRQRQLKHEDEQRKREERAEERRLKRLAKYGVQSNVQKMPNGKQPNDVQMYTPTSGDEHDLSVQDVQFDEQFLNIIEQFGWKPKTLMEKLDISRTSVYNHRDRLAGLGRLSVNGTVEVVKCSS